jgi:hypothetical protein
VEYVWTVLGWALLAGLVLLVAGAIRLWLRPPTTSGIISVAALVAFFVLGWTQGNKTGDARWTRPVNWPLQIRLLSAYPGIGEGACYDFIEPGVYVDPGGPGRDDTETEVTKEDAARQNRDVRECRARARRENRDYTKNSISFSRSDRNRSAISSSSRRSGQ